MIKKILIGLGVLLASFLVLGSVFFGVRANKSENLLGGATTLSAPQGGTGISSTVVGNIGKALTVSSISPLTYSFSSPGSSGFNFPLSITNGTTTSTLTANSFYIATSTANMAGLFFVDSSGNVSTSGSLKTFGNVTSTGLFYATGGFISSASSSIGSSLNITGNLNASGTLFVGAGSVTTPAIIMETVGTLSGIYSAGDGLVDISSNGSTAFQFSNNNMYSYASIWPNSNNTKDLGVFSSAWRNLYVSSTSYLADFQANGPSDGSVTSTIATSLNVGNDSVIYDASTTQTAVTSILQGPLNFDTDAGVVSAMDMPISTTTAGIIDSYSFSINSNPFLTIYAQTDGTGATKLPRIGFGTSTPASAYDFYGIGALDNVTTTFSLGLSTSTLKGTCLALQDVTGGTVTYVTAQGGVLTASTISCK